MKTYDLCQVCVITMRDTYKLTKIAGGVDNKITCANCRKRRYGATYELEKKKK